MFRKYLGADSGKLQTQSMVPHMDMTTLAVASSLYAHCLHWAVLGILVKNNITIRFGKLMVLLAYFRQV